MSVVFVNVAMVHAKPVQVEAVSVTKLLTWRPPIHGPYRGLLFIDQVRRWSGTILCEAKDLDVS